MKYLIILLFVSCALVPEKPNYNERIRKEKEDCVIRLVNEGVSEELAYPICKDIYEKKRPTQQSETIIVQSR